MENVENSGSSSERSVLGKRSWNSSWSSGGTPKKEKLIPLSEIESGLGRVAELRLTDRPLVNNRWVQSHLLKARYITVLSLEGTAITAKAGKTIGKLRGLRDLNISNTKFGNGLVYLKGLVHLVDLDIRSIGLSIDNIGAIPFMASVERLYIGGERDSEGYFHRIDCLTSLRKLKSLVLEVHGDDPGQLSQLTQLTSLHVLGTGNNRSFAGAAAHMRGLTELGLRSCGLLDGDLEGLQSLTRIGNLCLNGNPSLTTEGILVLEGLKETHCVELRGIPNLDRERINKIFTIPPDYDD